MKLGEYVEQLADQYGGKDGVVRTAQQVDESVEPVLTGLSRGRLRTLRNSLWSRQDKGDGRYWDLAAAVDRRLAR